MRVMIISLVLAYAMTSFVQAQNLLEEASPLSYRITFSKVEQKQRSVVINLLFQNVTDKPVIIDKKAVRYQLVYIKEGRKQGNGIGPSVGRVISGHPAPDVYKGEFLLLPPKGIYRATKTLYFTNTTDNFFEDGYEYSVSFTYGFFFHEQVNGLAAWRGTVESNKLGFRLSNNRFVPLKKAASD